VHNPGVRADPASWDQLVPCPPEKYPEQTRSHNFCIRTTHGYELILPPGISSYPAPNNNTFDTNQGLIIFVCAQPRGTSCSCLLGSARTLPPGVNIWHEPRSHNFCIHTTHGYELILPPGISSHHAPKKNKFDTNQGLIIFCMCTTQGYELILPPGISTYPAPRKNIRHKLRSYNPWVVRIQKL